jgi:hypothetical protein
VPKVFIDNPKRSFVYRAHAYGRKCECAPSNKDKETIESVQQDSVKLCKDGKNPQYRILTSSLHETAEGKMPFGIRSFALHTLKKATESE